MNKNIDIMIIKEEKKFLFIFKKIVTKYIVKNGDKEIYTTFNIENAQRYVKNYSEYHSLPIFIIEKNGNDKYRIRKKYKNAVDFNSTFFYFEYIIFGNDSFGSEEEAEKFIMDGIKEYQWEEVKKITIEELKEKKENG